MQDSVASNIAPAPPGSNAPRRTLVERSRGVVAPELLQRFVDTFLYDEGALFVDELVRVDAESRSLDAILDSTRPFPLSRAQRTNPLHPAHVSAAELLMVTGCLGCLHAYLFHGCRWDEGWAGFGNRIHRADFKRLARIGPPIALESRESRTRVGERRIVIRYDFRFLQSGQEVYRGDQSAMFVKGLALDGPAENDAPDPETPGHHM